METEALRNELLTSLYQILELDAFSVLDDFLQGETLLLRALMLSEGRPVNPSDLSDALHLSRSRITAALSALRRKGLVKMRMSEADRRRQDVTLTEEGLAVISEKVGQLNAYFDQLVEGLGGRETHRLIHLIERCVAVMEEEHE